MAASRTRTVKVKQPATITGSGKGGAAGKRSATDGISKPRSKASKGPTVSKQLKEKNRAALLKKPKKKTYSAEELGVPKLNMITPVGVVKPKGKKKGKVFVDDREGMTTIMSIVQAEKEGQIESKMIKARQLEEIREARKVEAEKKENERKEKLDNVKESLRKKRKRKSAGEDETLKDVTATGTNHGKQKKKSVSFA